MKGAKMDKPLLKVCGLKKSFGGVEVNASNIVST